MLSAGWSWRYNYAFTTPASGTRGQALHSTPGLKTSTVSNMSCPDYDTLLGFVQGPLEASRHDSVQEHVDGCETCFAATVDLAESLEEAFGGRDIATDETLAFVRRDGTGFEVPLSQVEGGTGQKIMSKLGSPGTDFDHFRVIRTLGRGGMAEVYLARDMKLGRKVALKVIKPALLGSD